jgi:V-type H+-transporting ATPase subunit D
MRGAAFALAQAKYSAGDFRATVQDNVGSASCRVRSATDNVAGVKIPRFERTVVGGGGSGGGGGGNAPSSHPLGGNNNSNTPSSSSSASATTPAAGGAPRTDLTGLGRGGQQVSLARAAFLDAVSLLVELASLQTAFVTLDVAIKTTNRRVNALDNVVRPRLEATIAYIKGELDELEREEFFRLKKVQAKKRRDAAAKEEGGGVGAAHKTSGGDGERSVSSLLGVEADADVVF